MKELIAEHRDGFKISAIVESAVIVETIRALRLRNFRSFTIKSISNVNPENYDWNEMGQWLSAN